MTTPTHPTRSRPGRLAAPLALAIGSLLAPLASSAGTTQVSGSYSYVAVKPFCAGLACYDAQYVGDLDGPATSALIATVPTTQGDLHCTVYAANDLGNDFGGFKPTDGEAGGLCKITGGTGAYAGASGSLLIYGYSEGSVGLVVLPGTPPRTGTFDYVGKVVTP
jgi:hypothetical protein